MKLKKVRKQRTYVQKPADLNSNWYLIDVAGLPLGRAATEISRLLVGKQKPTYTPHLNNGDFVIVINAAKVVLTGNKEEQKIYYRHSGYIGNLKQRTVSEQRQLDARKLIYKAVYGMLPKNKLRPLRLKRLKIYKDDSHPHQGQKPEIFKIKQSLTERKKDKDAGK